MIVDLPFKTSVAEDAFATAILGISYVFSVHWNDRENAYYFDVADADEKPIASGVKVVLGAFLGRTAQRSPFIDGVMIAVDTSRSGAPCGFDDLGARVKIRFFPVTDMQAAKGLALR